MVFVSFPSLISLSFPLFLLSLFLSMPSLLPPPLLSRLFFLRQGLTIQCRLVLNSLCTPGWPQTCSYPHASATRVLGSYCVHHHAQLLWFSFTQTMSLGLSSDNPLILRLNMINCWEMMTGSMLPIQHEFSTYNPPSYFR